MASHVLSSTARATSLAFRSVRTFVTGPALASSPYTSGVKDPATTTSPASITPQQRHALDSALRVDQAGEVAANWIYRGQHFVLGRDPITGPLIQVRSPLF